MMRRILFILSVIVLTTCNDREDYFANSNLQVKVELESPLTACTATQPGFINLDYAFNITLTPEYPKANPLPLVAQYTCPDASAFELSLGNKKYAPGDTIMFKSLSKMMVLNVSKPGTYKFLISFYKENDKEKELGKYEFNFVIGTPDLNMYVVRDGKRVENMEETENFLGYEGSFIVRINSEKEDLNKGRLKLTANITGSSVQVKNWQDKEAKISQSDDLPETVDFLVEYKNVALGKTKFVFTAESANSSAVLRDSMNVKESKPGTLSLNTTYNEEKNFYSREELWVGQTDSVGYLITPDPKAVSNVYRIKFEQKDPTKINFFATGDPEQFFTGHEYLPNQWYDFSDRLSGKIYYFSKGPTSYSDTVIISLQNGDMGPITKYKLFVSSKQSNDFDFNVTFKSTLDEEGYDVIKYTELREGFNELMTLDITDENPYSRFDYNMRNLGNEQQKNLVFTGKKSGSATMSAIPSDTWLAETYGHLTDLTSKSFNVICTNMPNESTAERWIGTFNWIFEVRQVSPNDQRYGDVKTVTRQIKIIDDRMDFKIDALVAKQEVYQNETESMFQMTYVSPDNKSENYQLTVTSSDASVADVYLVNSSGTFSDQKVDFGTAMTPPASHNVAGSSFPQSGHIQIKGKEEGTAELTFKLTHKTSGTSKEITQIVTTKADPVVYEIEPAPTMDVMNKERTAIPFNGQFHTYQNPRFRIRIKSSIYEKNRTEPASAVFSTVASINNVATLYISETGYIGNKIAYNDVVKLSYDKDYFVTMSAPTSHPWNVPAESEQWLNIKMTKATDQETKIAAEENGLIKYRLRAYNKPIFTVNATITKHDNISYTKSDYYTNDSKVPYWFGCATPTSIPVYPYDANFIRPKVIIKNGSANYYVSNAAITNGSILNDANESSYFTLKSNNAIYRVTGVIGRYTVIDNREDAVVFPQCTIYESIQADITDNWGYKSAGYFIPTPKFELVGNNKF